MIANQQLRRQAKRGPLGDSIAFQAAFRAVARCSQVRRTLSRGESTPSAFAKTANRFAHLLHDSRKLVAQDHRHAHLPALRAVILVDLAATHSHPTGRKQDFIIRQLGIGTSRSSTAPAFSAYWATGAIEFSDIHQSFRIFPSPRAETE